MANYSLVMDGKRCIGIWLANPGYAHDRDLLLALATEKHLPLESFAALSSGRFRIVPNRFDNKGGVFLMLTEAPAPGERR